jgi:beta-phosphoglucomutase family hydrolase
MKAVIWDLDGTLIDSVEYHWEAWREILPELNFSYTQAEFFEDFGKRNDEILRSRYRADLSDAEVERIAFDKEDRYRRLVRTSGLTLLPGCQQWLDWLRAHHFKQALGTSAPQGNVDAVLDALPLGEYFEVVMSADWVKRGKPAPDVFLAAAERMSVAPADCLVIEDAHAGVEAAQRAGMKCLGVLTTQKSLTADWVVASLADLPEDFFSKLNHR